MRPAVGLLLFYKEKSEENENMKNYKIAVAGTGYVGLSLSVLLAQHNQVMAVDIVQRYCAISVRSCTARGR